MLHIKNLRLSFSTYRGKIQAVRGVSLEVKPGEGVALVGESGCGKSATAKAILQLIDKPAGQIEGGQILFEGEDLLKKNKKQINKIRGNEIAMILQDPMTSLNPMMRIGKQILEASPPPHAKQRVLELLKSVGVSDPEKRFLQYPHQLSGGQRQRVMIAIALASSPKLLIADEPTTALDVTVQQEVLALIKKEQQKRKMGLLLITHDLGIVASMADKVIVMYGGMIVESGPTKQIFKAPSHPYTKGLLSSIPRLNLNSDTLQTIEGNPPNLINPPKGCPFCERCDEALRICALEPAPTTHLKSNHFVSCWHNEVRS